jgi:hypothetical protein
MGKRLVVAILLVILVGAVILAMARALRTPSGTSNRRPREARQPLRLQSCPLPRMPSRNCGMRW